ncbi:MAG: hypothetical protein ACRDON_01925 [Gaiellaceae bacterium]
MDTFVLCGGTTFSLDDGDPRVASYVGGQMDPYRVELESVDALDVVLEIDRERAARRLTDVQNPAGDGVVTASDGARHYVLWRGQRCMVPTLPGQGPVRFTYEPGFPLSRIFRSAVRPALQIAMLNRESAAVHASAAEWNGTALLIGGWSESGKTETALAFLEEGARFLSDKWSVLTAGGVVGAFPISAGIRRWVLRYLPRLRASLPAGARTQLAAAALASAASSPLRGRRLQGRAAGTAADALERALALADRAALTPTQLRAAYGQQNDSIWSSRLGAVALLTTIQDEGVAAREADAAWAARRLARAASFERRSFFEILARARYAFPDRDMRVMEIEREEERLLEAAFSEARVLEVRAPFPTDPRRVADAIAHRL